MDATRSVSDIIPYFGALQLADLPLTATHITSEADLSDSFQRLETIHSSAGRPSSPTLSADRFGMASSHATSPAPSPSTPERVPHPHRRFSGNPYSPYKSYGPTRVQSVLERASGDDEHAPCCTPYNEVIDLLHGLSTHWPRVKFPIIDHGWFPRLFDLDTASIEMGRTRKMSPEDGCDGRRVGRLGIRRTNRPRR